MVEECCSIIGRFGVFQSVKNAPIKCCQFYTYVDFAMFTNISEADIFFLRLDRGNGQQHNSQWSDHTRPLNTFACCHRSGYFVRNTSKILWPRVEILTIWRRAWWLIKSIKSSWFTSPAIMNVKLGSHDKARWQESDINSVIRLHYR